MKRILICIIFVVTGFVTNAQDSLIGDWRINFLIGFDSVNEFVITPPDSGTVHIYGNAFHLKNDGTFYCNYSAPCGLDCFRTSSGTYAWVDENHILFVTDRLRTHGTCGYRFDTVDISSPIYYVLKTNDGYKFIEGTVDNRNDDKNAEYSQYIDDYFKNITGRGEAERFVGNTQNLPDLKAIVIACLRDRYQKSDEIEILYIKDIGEYANDRKIVLFTHNGVRKLVRLFPNSQSAELLL